MIRQFCCSVALLSLLSACGTLPLDAVKLVPNTLSEGLVAYWAFDDGQGTTVADRSGNRRDGALTGGTWLTDGRFGGALRFGNGEYVTVAAFPDATPGFSVSAWVRLNQYTQGTTDDTNWGTIVSTETSGGWEMNIDQFSTSPGINFGFWRGPNQGDYDSYTCSCLDLGRWTHFMAVVDGSRKAFDVYVDGELRNTTAFSQNILPGSPTLTVGEVPWGARYLVGDVDDIAIYSRALVPAEVASLHEHPPIAPP
jgi:hypothetical protein